MKKTLLSLFALALSLTAAAQLTTTPEGKLIDNLYRSSDSWVQKGYIGKEPGHYEGLVSKIVEGKDGFLYVYNPLSGLNSKSWLKLEKVDGTTYKAVLPQAIDKDNSGGDDDDESNSERILMLNRMVHKGDGKYEVVANDKNFMEYTWDGKTLKMKGVDSQEQILALTYDNAIQGNYGDWNVTISALDQTLVAPPPAGAEAKQYSLTAKNVTSPRIVDAAVSGNDLYIKGLFKSTKLANVWVKLSKEGDKYVFTTNQYLGEAVKADFKGYSSDKSEYHTFAAAFADDQTVADRLEFTVDATTGTLTTDKFLKISLGKSSAANLPKEELESYEALKLTPYVETVGEPKAPTKELLTYTYTRNYPDKEVKLMIKVENATVDGTYLNPDHLYYNIYVNHSTTPFTFTREDYSSLDQDLTNIPFNFSDKRRTDIKVVGDTRILYFYERGDAKFEHFSVVMVYEKDGKKYSSQPLTIVGIKPIAAGDNTAKEYFTLDGRRLDAPQKGLNIVKSADGTTQKVLVK